MGFSFRKSIKAGPFRVNLSKSGVGVSAGVKGARVSTGPRGSQVAVGRGGMRYTRRIGRNVRDEHEQPTGRRGGSTLKMLALLVVALFVIAIIAGISVKK